MNVALRPPAMSREQFLDWVQRQEAPYEFDGSRPVPMTGGSRRHSQIMLNIHVALRARLRGTSCTHLGPDAGVATVERAVRYPDALVTCTAGHGTDLLIAGVVAVFEVVSPSSDRTDRLQKTREYLSVPSIQLYVILEQTSAGVTVLQRGESGSEWTARVLIKSEILHMPEIGIEIPISEFYEDVDLPDEPTGSDEAG